MFEHIPASDRETWLALRGKDVTASVCGALLGVHEYTTAYSLWALKTGRITDDPEETPAMRRGTLLEPVAVEILRQDHPGWEIHHNTGDLRIYYRDSEARVGATPDILVHEGGRLGVVQVKSVEQSVYRRKWLMPERGDVEPPLWIAIQALIEGHLVGADWVAVAPLVVGFGIDLPLIMVPPKPKIVEMVYEKTEEFWRIVKTGEEMSPDFARDGETIERMFGADDGSEADLSRAPRADQIVLERGALSASIKEAEEAKKALDSEMKAILGNHAVGRLADGRKVTWKTINRKGYEVAPTQFRQLRYPS